MDKFNIIFLSLMFSEESLKKAYHDSKCGVQIATHVFQDNIYKGFLAQENVNISIINILPVGSFPLNYRKAVISTKDWNGNTEIGYFNIPYIKQTQQKYAIEREIRKRIRKGENNVILLYSLYLPFLQAAVKIKKEFRDIRICLIQTDCVDGRNGMQKYYSERVKRRGDKQVRLAKNVDGFIVLTKYLCEPLEVNERPYKVIECICDETQLESYSNNKTGNVCLYTGTLDSCYGIMDLVRAFSQIQNAELWICGDGDAKDFVVKSSNNHMNIKYFGFVDHERMNELRDRCDYLINPRRPDGTYTLYSFPSKTTEYMLSGKPTIMYKLEGIPDEYDEYLLYLSGETPDSISVELASIFSENYSLQLERAKNGREFMLQRKNRRVQTKKILELMKSLS